MDANLLVFLVLSLVAVASALGMLLNKNAVYSAMFLIINFATVAVFYIILGAPFIAMTQVTVYAGAIMVLFLFVIMLLGAEKLERRRTFDWQRLMAVILAGILLVEAGVVVFGGQEYVTITESAESFGAPAALGLDLFNNYFLPFQITAVLLLSAMVGAIVITRFGKKKEETGKRSN